MEMKITKNIKKQIYILKTLKSLDLKDLDLVRREALKLKMYELLAFINKHWQEYLEFVHNIN